MHLGTPSEGDAFLESRWPEARAVSDPSKLLYRGFGLQRARLSQLFGPKALLAGIRARSFGAGRPKGDPMMMSGWFLVDGGEIVWRHVHQHAGEERRMAEVISAYAKIPASNSEAEANHIVSQTPIPPP